MPKISKELKHKVEQKIKECLKIAEEHYGFPFEYPKVKFKNLGPTGGLFTYDDNGNALIELNSFCLFDEENDFIATTVPHEVAHLVSHELSQYCAAHGRKWTEVMKLFNVPPDIFHTHDTTKALKHFPNKTKRYCDTCGQNFIFGETSMGTFLISETKDVKLHKRRWYHTPCKSFIE